MKYGDLEDMVYRMNLTNDQIENKLNEKNFGAEIKRFSIPHGKYMK